MAETLSPAPLPDSDNRDFIAFCFRAILGREPDEAGAAAYGAALDAQALTREQVLLRFISSPEFQARGQHAEMFPAGHYYSAIPSAEDRQTYLSLPDSTAAPAGIALDNLRQLHLLTRLQRHYAECPFRAHKTPGLRYFFENESYSYGDAVMLYAMMREFTPRRVIEIGSGYSSCVMLDTAELFLGESVEFVFIDPYPTLLKSLLKSSDRRHTILPRRLQDLDTSMFSSLQRDDILFVDSTHVAKLGSDVNRIFFEILPLLNDGVIVHVHDIFWPFEYPKEWVRKGIAWNEAYLLRAFLQFNERFEIMLFGNLMYRTQRDWFEQNMPLVLLNPGGHIWLRKHAGEGPSQTHPDK